MEVFKLLFISILSIIFTVQWVTSQEFKEPGYDLHKGPVFYEAYYYPEKQNLHKRRSIEETKKGDFEKSFQVSKSPSNVFVTEDGSVMFIVANKVTPLPMRTIKVGTNNYNLVPENYPRQTFNQDFQKSASSSKYQTDDKVNSVSNNRLLPQFQENPFYQKNLVSNFVAPLQNNYPLDIKFNRDENQNFVYDNRRYQNLYDSRDENFKLNDPRSFPESLQENIFEPRPQIINYLFSAPRGNESGEKKSNFVKGDAQVDAATKDEPGIASIEVSEEPRHKIRHHHGERPKRNYIRQ